MTKRRPGVLTPEQRELFRSRLRDKGIAGHLVKIEQVSRRGPVPLSFAQQRLWFFEQLHPGNPAYNDLYAVRFTGRLDRTALQWALDTIVERHEALRTSFEVVNGWPVQRIREPFVLTTPYADLSSLPVDDDDESVRTIGLALARDPFDLTRGPLIRTRLFRIGPSEHVLLIAVHHIVSDGRSFSILFRELGALYGSRRTGVAPRLTRLPIQYADYAAWEQQSRSRALLDTELPYWRKQLCHPLPDFTLPLDHARRDQQSFRGAGCAWVVPPDLRVRLAAFAREHEATLFMTLCTAFQILLHHWTGQTDTLVGFPISNRQVPGSSDVFGMFVNTLPFRTDLSGDPDISTILGRVRQNCLDAYARPNLPLERIIQEVGMQGYVGGNPLFQAFVLQHSLPAALEVDGVTMHPVLLDNGSAKLDLELWIVDEESESVARGGVPTAESEKLVLRIQYNTDLFDVATIQRLMHQCQHIVQWLVDKPSQSLSMMREALSRGDGVQEVPADDRAELGESRARLNRARRVAIARPVFNEAERA